MRVDAHPAFVLHQREFRESSAIVEVFSARHGRVAVVAKGVKAAKSPYRNLLRLFQPILIGWSGRGELRTLTAAESGGTAIDLGGRRLILGFYINELLLRLLPKEDPHPNLFARYARTLQAIERVDIEECPLRYFEKHLLHELGYGLILDKEADSGQPIVSGTLYNYRREFGPSKASARAEDSVPIHGQTLIGLSQEDLAGAGARKEAKVLMRFLLLPLLGDKPLHSRKLYRDV